jgi:hypothetical protein
MIRRSERNDVTDRVRLCVELVQRSDARDSLWALVVSIPGRESVIQYQWRAVGGVMNESQLRDMAAKLGHILTQAVVTLDGAQQELRLTR